MIEIERRKKHIEGLNRGIWLAAGLYEGLLEKSKPVLEGEIE